MSSDPSQPAKPRWYQFDLRTLLLLVTMLGVVFAMEAQRRGDKPKAKSVLDGLQMGDRVTLELMSTHGSEHALVVKPTPNPDGDDPLDFVVQEIAGELVRLKGQWRELFLAKSNIVQVVRLCPDGKLASGRSPAPVDGGHPSTTIGAFMRQPRPVLPNNETPAAVDPLTAETHSIR